MSARSRRALAEFAGTAVIVFAPVACLAGGGGLPEAAIVSGLAVLIMVAATGPISGAHLNPAVTLAFAAARRFPWRDAPAYIAVQAAGATAAALAARGLFGVAAGTHHPAVGAGRAIGIECAITFVLVFVIFAVATSDRVHGAVAPVAIGAAVTVGVFAAGAATGGSMNPARSLGPALVHGGAPLAAAWIYAVGPVAGGLLAAAAHRAVRDPAEPWRSVPPGLEV